MRYLTYDEYTAIGGALSETAFERVIDRACGLIDYYTQKRVRNISDGATQIGETLYIFGSSVGTVVEQVQACIRDLCDYLDSNATAGSKAVTAKSQSAGGVSESESYAAKTADEIGAETRGIIFDYLSSETDVDGTPLLYRGCRP